jgi:hypothetical protein
LAWLVSSLSFCCCSLPAVPTQHPQSARTRRLQRRLPCHCRTLFRCPALPCHSFVSRLACCHKGGYLRGLRCSLVPPRPAIEATPGRRSSEPPQAASLQAPPLPRSTRPCPSTASAQHQHAQVMGKPSASTPALLASFPSPTRGQGPRMCPVTWVHDQSQAAWRPSPTVSGRISPRVTRYCPPPLRLHYTTHSRTHPPS